MSQNWNLGNDPEAREWANTANNLMNRAPRFVVENIEVTNGAILLRVREFLRRFMIKAAYPGTEDPVRNERRWINLLQWAKHIVNPVTVEGALLNDNVWMLPSLFVEFLENGTLAQFQDRIRTAGTLPDGTRGPLVLPNRMLWGIFLCLVRSCIGMAWPPPLGPVSSEVPLDNVPLRLAHNDLHGRNIMFGDLEPSLPEHSRVPGLKLIDLEIADEQPDGESAYALDERELDAYDRRLDLESHRAAQGRRNQGMDKNILDMGIVMTRILRGGQFATVNGCRTTMCNEDYYPSLDPDLRLLIQRCLAVDPLNRPRLEELSDAETFLRPESYYAERDPSYAGLESDEYIKRIVSDYILSAETEEQGEF
ncbi:hypothetical protein F4778DRAFT_752840 [Xylariomycetidae sp. FL2044]|nr:hypothetical protein F4778DRAFT_752840 [Xylariomycetidae sp. FL2044]